MQLVATLAPVTAYAFADRNAARAEKTPLAPEPSAALGTSFQDELSRRVAAIDRSGIIVGFIDGDTVTVFKATLAKRSNILISASRRSGKRSRIVPACPMQRS